MTAKRAEKIVAILDNFEDCEPDISTEQLIARTAFAAHCDEADVSTALIIADNLKDIPMTTETLPPPPPPVYTLAPSPHNREELILTTHEPRACQLALAIGGRESKRGEMFFTPARAVKWRLLYEAGVLVVPGRTSWRYYLNGKALGCLSEAVNAARAILT